MYFARRFWRKIRKLFSPAPPPCAYCGRPAVGLVVSCRGKTLSGNGQSAKTTFHVAGAKHACKSCIEAYHKWL